LRLAEARQAYWAAHASAERRAVARERAPLLQAVQGVGTTDAQIRRYVLASHLYWFDPRFDCAFLWEGTTFPPQWPARFMALWDGYDLPGRFPEVRCPVFLGHGRYDFACPPTVWEGERERFPDGTYRLFDRSGHAPQLDEPAAFTAAVSAWLTPAAARRRPGAAAGCSSAR
jgi:proline iminopeptidase